MACRSDCDSDPVGTTIPESACWFVSSAHGFVLKMAGDITTNEVPSDGNLRPACFLRAPRSRCLDLDHARSESWANLRNWSAYSTEYARFSPRSLLALDGRSGSGCVLRTASVSISRSSALVFGGSRV
jgi:hypothetical protein